MKDTALGCMGWKPEDFDRYWLGDLISACQGRIQDIKIKQEFDRELARAVAYYSAAPMAGKSFKYSDVIMPGDKQKPVIVGEMKKLTREGLKERYKKSGFEISEEALDNIFKSK